MIGGLHAKLELPEDDEALVGRRVTVSGWAVYQAKPVLAVAVTLAGPLWTRTELATQNSRADVAEHFGADTDLLGWEASFDVEEADARCEFETFATVWGAIGVMPESTERHRFSLVADELAETELRGSLEHPAADDELSDRDLLFVRGWAATNNAPVEEVEVLLNGQSMGRARLGLHRPDVGEMWPHPASHLAGFEHYVDLERFSPPLGALTVEAVARLGETSVSVGERRLELLPSRRGANQRAKRRELVLRQRTADLLAKSAPARSTTGELDLLVVTHDLGYGGAQLWLTELLDKAGAGSDFPCTVLSRAPGGLTAVLERAGIDVHVRDEYTLRDIEMYESQVAELALWSRSLGHNAVLVNTMGAFVGADIAARLGLPCAWAIHESWPPSEYWKVNFPKGFVDERVRTAAQHVLSSCPAVVFETESTQALFEGAVEREASLLVPYGVDLAAIDAYRARTSKASARRRLGLDPDGRVLLLLGTIEPRKAQTVLAEAFGHVAARYPDTVLVLVGDQATTYSAALKGYLQDAHLGERVRVEPVTKDIFPWYRAADLFVCASDVESMPRSVLEAMAFGVPVAATAVFGLPELIEHGKTGWLFGARSVREAAQLLDDVLSLDGGTLDAVGEAGERVVREKHDSRDYSRTLVRLLQAMRQSPGVSARSLLERIHGEAAAAPRAPESSP